MMPFGDSILDVIGVKSKQASKAKQVELEPCVDLCVDDTVQNQ